MCVYYSIRLIQDKIMHFFSKTIMKEYVSAIYYSRVHRCAN